MPVANEHSRSDRLTVAENSREPRFQPQSHQGPTPGPGEEGLSHAICLVAAQPAHCPDQPASPRPTKVYRTIWEAVEKPDEKCFIVIVLLMNHLYAAEVFTRSDYPIRRPDGRCRVSAKELSQLGFGGLNRFRLANRPDNPDGISQNVLL